MPVLNEYKIYTVRDNIVKKSVGKGEFRKDTKLSKQLLRLLRKKRKFIHG